MNILIKPIFAFATLLTAAFSFSSCLKEKNIDPVPTAALTFINAAASPDSLNFYFDKQLVTSERKTTYAESSEMIVFQAGSHELLISASNVSNPLTSVSYPFLKDNYYSIFATTSSSGNILVVNTDILKEKDPSKAKVRFAHMSSDAPKINISNETGDLFSGLEFKTVSDFKDIAPGTYTFKIAESTDGTPKIAQSLSVQADKIYTIWCGGSWDSTTGKTAFKLFLTEY